MVTITIRNVPDATHAVLADRAAASGRSLQEYLRRLMIDSAARPDPAEMVERMERRVHASQTAISADAILAARDSERR